MYTDNTQLTTNSVGLIKNRADIGLQIVSDTMSK